MFSAARRDRGQRHPGIDDEITELIGEWTGRVGVGLACRAFGVPERTWRHHRQRLRGELPVRRSRATGQPRRAHPAKLSEEETARVLAVLCEPRFADSGVTEIWATLLDEGVYLCSESTMHRILREHGLAGQRRQHPGRVGHSRPRVVATAPNMVWCWDITRLRGPARGIWFYLYVIYDLWSRKAVGWCVHPEEHAKTAYRLIEYTARRERVDRHQLIIHSDRGAQMTSGTLTDLYDTLGIRRSLSRPRVSNDNPHAEAGFKTLKYRPDWPEQFDRIDDAVAYCEQFFWWYNVEHHHSGIGLLTPHDRHTGNGHRVHQARQHTLDQAFKAYPERFPNGRPTPPEQPAKVWINPPTQTTNNKP